MMFMSSSLTMNYSATWLVIGTSIFGIANCLTIQSVQEGGCVERLPDRHFNQTWFVNTQFRYFPAGSKSNQYRFIQGHANFDRLREFEFYYDSCTWATPIENDEAALYAFNQVLGIAKNFVFTKPGVLEIDYTVQPRREILRPRHTVTLTDNETFVFWSTCWTTTQDAGWAVYSTKPYLDAKLKKIIEKHAASLGFNRNNFVFMRRETCNELPVGRYN